MRSDWQLILCCIGHKQSYAGLTHNCKPDSPRSTLHKLHNLHFGSYRSLTQHYNKCHPLACKDKYKKNKPHLHIHYNPLNNSYVHMQKLMYHNTIHRRKYNRFHHHIADKHQGYLPYNTYNPQHILSIQDLQQDSIRESVKVHSLPHNLYKRPRVWINFGSIMYSEDGNISILHNHQQTSFIPKVYYSIIHSPDKNLLLDNIQDK